MSEYTEAWLHNASEKTGAILELARLGAEREPLVRRVAIQLTHGLPREDHIGRIRRLHEFVRDTLGYVREPIEMLHQASVTLELGAGDCDDHAIVLGALAWSLKYPIAIRPIGDPENPAHYSMQIGYPYSETISGDADTTWVHVETTAPALTGESVEQAMRR